MCMKLILYGNILQKETSEAVNSIMGLTASNAMDDNDATINRDTEGDEYLSQSEYAAAKIEDLENIKGINNSGLI